jgi:hypothetical protein
MEFGFCFVTRRLCRRQVVRLCGGVGGLLDQRPPLNLYKGPYTPERAEEFSVGAMIKCQHCEAYIFPEEASRKTLCCMGGKVRLNLPKVGAIPAVGSLPQIPTEYTNNMSELNDPFSHLLKNTGFERKYLFDGLHELINVKNFDPSSALECFNCFRIDNEITQFKDHRYLGAYKAFKWYKAYTN